MVDCIGDPGGKGADAEEGVVLADVIELWIPIEQTCRDELVEDTHCQRWQNGIEDVVERESPGFVDDFAREDVLEGVLMKVSDPENTEEKNQREQKEVGVNSPRTASDTR